MTPLERWKAAFAANQAAYEAVCEAIMDRRAVSMVPEGFEGPLPDLEPYNAAVEAAKKAKDKASAELEAATVALLETTK